MPEMARRRGERPMEERIAVVMEGVVALLLISWEMAAAMRTAMARFR